MTFLNLIENNNCDFKMRQNSSYYITLTTAIRLCSLGENFCCFGFGSVDSRDNRALSTSYGKVDEILHKIAKKEEHRTRPKSCTISFSNLSRRLIRGFRINKCSIMVRKNHLPSRQCETRHIFNDLANTAWKSWCVQNTARILTRLPTTYSGLYRTFLMMKSSLF